VEISSRAEGVAPVVGVVSRDDAAESVGTEGVGVRALAECVSGFTAVDTQVHPVEEADWESRFSFVMEPRTGVPVAGLVSVELECFKDGEGTPATMLGVFILGVRNEGSTREIGMEVTVSTSDCHGLQD
jgi:hypothetical protein